MMLHIRFPLVLISTTLDDLGHCALYRTIHAFFGARHENLNDDIAAISGKNVAQGIYIVVYTITLASVGRF